MDEWEERALEAWITLRIEYINNHRQRPLKPQEQQTVATRMRKGWLVSRPLFSALFPLDRGESL